MHDEIPPTPEALEEALELSSDILKDVELNRVPLRSAALKASRLARLLNHVEAQNMFHYEASGYPSTPTGVRPEVWSLLQMASRTSEENVPNSQGKTRTVAFLESIEHLEHELEACKLGLDAARDRDVSVSSANPEQFVTPRWGIGMNVRACTQGFSLHPSVLQADVLSYTSMQCYGTMN